MLPVARISGISDIFNFARSEGRNFLFEYEAKKLCALYNLPVTQFKLSKNVEEAVDVSIEFGFPIVLKIVSPQILHKSDVGGVIVDIKDEDGVREAYNQILENVESKVPEAEITGILVQEMAPSSIEIIIGSTRDPTFGPVIMFGLGGIFVEVLEDVSFRLIPISKMDAVEMLTEIRAYKILEGARGKPPVDQEAIVDCLIKTSKMLVECPEIRELDLNPIFVYEEGTKIVDARIIFE